MPLPAPSYTCLFISQAKSASFAQSISCERAMVREWDVSDEFH